MRRFCERKAFPKEEYRIVFLLSCLMRKTVYCATTAGRAILRIRAAGVKYCCLLTPDLNFPSKYNTALEQLTIAWYDVQGCTGILGGAGSLMAFRQTIFLLGQQQQRLV